MKHNNTQMSTRVPSHKRLLLELISKYEE